MVNRKQTLRLGTFLAILMFLLVPLLSSPVAAAFTLNLGSVTTNNTPGGPTATGVISAPATIFDTTPWNANFVVSYSYTDSNPGGLGSIHWLTVSVTWQPGGTGPWSGPNVYTQLAIFLPANWRTITGFYTTPWITGYGGKGTNFQVNVVVNCQDISLPFTATWSSLPQRFTII